MTKFNVQREAEAAFAAAKAQHWGTGVGVSLKVEKACGTPCGWEVVVTPKHEVGVDLSCVECGMSAHPTRSGCPAHPRPVTFDETGVAAMRAAWATLLRVPA